MSLAPSSHKCLSDFVPKLSPILYGVRAALGLKSNLQGQHKSIIGSWDKWSLITSLRTHLDFFSSLRPAKGVKFKEKPKEIKLAGRRDVFTAA